MLWIALTEKSLGQLPISLPLTVFSSLPSWCSESPILPAMGWLWVWEHGGVKKLIGLTEGIKCTYVPSQGVKRCFLGGISTKYTIWCWCQKHPGSYEFTSFSSSGRTLTFPLPLNYPWSFYPFPSFLLTTFFTSSESHWRYLGAKYKPKAN